MEIKHKIWTYECSTINVSIVKCYLFLYLILTHHQLLRSNHHDCQLGLFKNKMSKSNVQKQKQLLKGWNILILIFCHYPISFFCFCFFFLLFFFWGGGSNRMGHSLHKILKLLSVFIINKHHPCILLIWNIYYSNI